ncbi:hypothetical protein MMC14_008610 [Varicellaria rhodocarpa]|nr:hypothetical protein [Varicellaria rhodocarpa]
MAGPSAWDIPDLVTKLTSTELKSKALLASTLVHVPRGYELVKYLEPELLLHLSEKLETQFGTHTINGKAIRYRFSAKELLSKGAIDIPECQPSSLSGEVHPLFQRDNFDDCPDRVYDQLIPGLQLATRFITSSELLQYWITTTLGERKRKRDSSGGFYRERIMEEVPITPKNTADFIEASRTWSKLVHVIFVPQLSVRGVHGPCCGITHPIVDYNKMESLPYSRSFEGLPPSATRSSIKLHGDFYIAASKFAVIKHPNISHKMRFNFLLAITVVHELAHALENVFKDIHCPEEVYMGNNLVSEAGSSWENSVFGGTITAVNGRMDCLLGLTITDWPPTHVGGHAMGMSPAIVSSVPMDYVAAVQQESFWQHKVHNNGALLIPRDKSAYSLAIPFTTTMRRDEEGRVRDAESREGWIQYEETYLKEAQEPPTQRRKLHRDGSSAMKADFRGRNHALYHKGRQGEDDSDNTDEDTSDSSDEFILGGRSAARKPIRRPLTGPGRIYLAPDAGQHVHRDRSRSSSKKSREEKMRREQRWAMKEHQKSMRELSRVFQGTLAVKDTEEDVEEIATGLSKL